MVTKGRDFSRMKVLVTPIVKLLRPEEGLANGEGNLEGVIEESGDEYQCGLEASCSCSSSTSYLLAHFSSKGVHPKSWRSYSQMGLIYYKYIISRFKQCKRWTVVDALVLPQARHSG